MDKKSMVPAMVDGGDALPQVIELAGNQKLVIQRTRPLPSAPVTDSEDLVRLLDAEGATSLTIRLGAEGAVIELGGGPVALSVEGDLAISSRRLMLHGREEVAISSEADIRVVAQENALVQAKRQDLVATRGNLKAHANDDVLIDGERIRMNC
jgi:hypothetical protein